VAHEVFKIVSGKYSPLTHQERFFSINLIAQLYRSGLTPEQCAPVVLRFDLANNSNFRSTERHPT